MKIKKEGGFWKAPHIEVALLADWLFSRSAGCGDDFFPHTSNFDVALRRGDKRIEYNTLSAGIKEEINAVVEYYGGIVVIFVIGDDGESRIVSGHHKGVYYTPIFFNARRARDDEHYGVRAVVENSGAGARTKWYMDVPLVAGAGRVSAYDGEH